jgi:hypothetical protein
MLRTWKGLTPKDVTSVKGLNYASMTSDLGQEPLVGVLEGEVDEAGGGEDEADEHADGGSNEAEHQLDVGQQQAHAERQRHDHHRDAPERRLRDRLVDDVVVVRRVHLHTKIYTSFRVL